MPDDHVLRLPTSVATLPMFALIASATDTARAGFARTITATTSGVSIRHTVSFTSNADKIPECQVKEE